MRSASLVNSTAILCVKLSSSEAVIVQSAATQRLLALHLDMEIRDETQNKLINLVRIARTASVQQHQPPQHEEIMASLSWIVSGV